MSPYPNCTRLLASAVQAEGRSEGEITFCRLRSSAAVGVSIFLDQRLDGFKLEADYGQSEREDGQDRHVAAAFGTAFAGDRGHVDAAHG